MQKIDALIADLEEAMHRWPSAYVEMTSNAVPSLIQEIRRLREEIAGPPPREISGWCADLRVLLGIPETRMPCCTQCHLDFDETGQGDMQILERGDRLFLVCCRVESYCERGLMSSAEGG